MEPHVEARFERIERDLAMLADAHRVHSEEIGRILDTLDRLGERTDKLGERVDGIAEIQKVQAERLIQIIDVQRDQALTQRDQARVIRQLAESQVNLAESMAGLAEAQKVTEQKLQALLDSLRQGGNGRPA